MPLSVPSDIEIATSVKPRPIVDVARDIGLEPDDIEQYGKYKAKLPLELIDETRIKKSKLILVTALSPTPAGEGKTTTSIGLHEGLSKLGKRGVVVLREPSLGPVFGMKGGAAGGGYAQVVPMEDINLHFTGDFAAIGLANNLLAGLIDNHIYWGNELGFDVRRVTWRRVVDVNDRSLREITAGLGGTANGYPRQDGFDIVVASEVMAIFCLATSLKDLKERLGKIVVGYTREQKPILARDLKAHPPAARLAGRPRGLRPDGRGHPARPPRGAAGGNAALALAAPGAHALQPARRPRVLPRRQLPGAQVARRLLAILRRAPVGDRVGRVRQCVSRGSRGTRGAR